MSRTARILQGLEFTSELGLGLGLRSGLETDLTLGTAFSERTVKNSFAKFKSGILQLVHAARSSQTSVIDKEQLKPSSNTQLQWQIF